MLGHCLVEGEGLSSLMALAGQWTEEHSPLSGSLLRLVGRSVRRARGGVILKSTTNKGGLL
jgi:hypothetical protein